MVYYEYMKSNRSRLARLKQIWAKTDGVCAHCGNHSSGMNRTIDHYVPKSFDGGYDTRNLMPLCKKCNQERGNRPVDPYIFYAHAPKRYILLCIEYENEYMIKHRNMNGEICY